MVAMGGLLAARFVRALRQVEGANMDLTRKVDEKEQELRHQLRTPARSRATRGEPGTERQRIMQDMHDGLGSQLLTSLAAVERGALDSKGMAQVLRDAMDDMRLAIDTLSPGREGLARSARQPALPPRAALSRGRRRVDASPTATLPDQLAIAAEDALQILRVLQESLTNVLKHARAKAVAVEISPAARSGAFRAGRRGQRCAASTLHPPHRVAACRACVGGRSALAPYSTFPRVRAERALRSVTRFAPLPRIAYRVRGMAGRSAARFAGFPRGQLRS